MSEMTSTIMALIILAVGAVAVAGATLATAGPSAVRALVRPGPILAIGLLAFFSIGMHQAIAAMRLQLEKKPIYAPDDRQMAAIAPELPTWRRAGSDRRESPEVEETLGTRNYLNRTYVTREPDETGKLRPIDFHAAYYTNSIDTVPHVPERCFIGGGLQLADESRTVVVPLDTRRWAPDPRVPAELAGRAGVLYTVPTAANPEHTSGTPNTRVRLPRDLTPIDLPTPELANPMKLRVGTYTDPVGRRIYTAYFFIANGGWVPNATQVRTIAFDLTSEYTYYCKVQFTATEYDSLEHFLEAAGSLLGELLPEILRCVPPWVEVMLGEYPPSTDDA